MPAPGLFVGEEKRLLQIGGLTALPAGLVWIVGAIGVAFFGIAETAEETLLAVQQAGAQSVVPRVLALILMLLTVLLFLALHRVSKSVGATRALLGATLGVSGALLYVVNFAIGSTAWLVFADLHAAAPPAEQTIIVIAAEVIEQIQHALQLLGFLLIGLAFIAFGWALLEHGDIAKGYGWAGVIVGALVALSGLVGLSGPQSAPLGVGFGGMGVLFLLFGWKAFRMSGAA